ncbi:MAG: hypothetical protein GF350_13095 [Chitinivibrionales bacterium]|nr:hypothetical protein [Chitinivibrionales bacterium]
MSSLQESCGCRRSLGNGSQPSIAPALQHSNLILSSSTLVACAACGDSEGENTKICVYRKPDGEQADPTFVQDKNARLIHLIWTGRTTLGNEGGMAHAVLDPALIVGEAQNRVHSSPIAVQQRSVSMQGNSRIELDLPRSAQVRAGLYDLNGRLAKALISGSLSDGTHAFRVGKPDLSAGSYLLKIKVDNSVVSLRIAISD